MINNDEYNNHNPPKNKPSLKKYVNALLFIKKLEKLKRNLQQTKDPGKAGRAFSRHLEIKTKKQGTTLDANNAKQPEQRPPSPQSNTSNTGKTK